MGIEDIKGFLVRANGNGYGSKNVKEFDEKDGSHTITYSESDWFFHDNFFGGEPFGGREVISYKDEPVWMMVYYGFAINLSLQKEIYIFLRKSLLNFTPEIPYRGPEKLLEGDWIYTCKVKGAFDNFKGLEEISYKNKKVYQANFSGGRVDSF